jgi:leucyl aminopeptidase
VQLTIQFSTKVGAPDKLVSPCVVVGVMEPRKLGATAETLDRTARGALRELLRLADMDGKPGSVRVLYKVPHLACERVVLMGLGRPGELTARTLRDALRAAVSAVADIGTAEAHLYLADALVPGHDLAWTLRQAALAATDALYRYERTKSRQSPARTLKRVVFALAERAGAAAADRAVREGRAIAAGVALAKDLGNLPPNVCTPTYLAEEAQRLGKAWKLGVDVLERKDMEKLGMGALLSVARGSREPPKLIVMRHDGGAKKAKPVVLVGKGITFDTGGISLKPGAEMDEMKFDMCGAASVFGTLRAVAEMKLPLNVVGVVPATENMPDGAATKPGDVVTSMSGQTVEILNTDAEGRLILCDALTYAERFEPAAVVDIATLTGACVIALGHVASGLYANQDELADELLESSRAAWDRAWRLPLWDDYQEQLKSNFADMANIGGRPAGSVTAACFLARFTGKYHWAHLDIAGTAWLSGKAKGATGRPVPLLTDFLMKRAARA